MHQISLTSNRLKSAIAGCFLILLSSLGCDNSSTTLKNEEPSPGVDIGPAPIELNQREIVESGLRSGGESNSGKFVDLPSSHTGVDFANRWPDKLEPALWNSFISAGVAVGDFNDDGLVDFFAARRSDGGRLFQNVGAFRFEDVTDEFGLSFGSTWGSGATWVDINNDGRLDLFVCGYNSPNRLFINYGDRFVDQTNDFGLEFSGASVVMTFSDYDRDGDLDAFLLTNRVQQLLGEKQPNIKLVTTPSGPKVPEEFREESYVLHRRDGRYQLIPGGQFDHFFENRDDKFVEVTEEVGIGSEPYLGLSATWWDYDNDGWPDLYVANDFYGPDHLYRNNGTDENGKVTFAKIDELALPHTPWYSMGSDTADINNDGRMDLLASDMAGTNHYRDKLSMGAMSGPDSNAWFLNWPTPPQYMRNCLYLNSGSERFMEAAFLFGVAKTDWTWTVRFSDFDQDGWQDVYFTNGMSRDWFNGDILAKAREIEATEGKAAAFHYQWRQPRFELENLAFRNTGELGFKNVSKVWGLDHLGVSTGGATADFDGDGDLDLIINDWDGPLKIYRNEVALGTCLKIKLVGRSSNRQAVGARVELIQSYDDTNIQTRFMSSNQGFMSSSEPIVHFGTGDARQVAQLKIYWPSGIVQQFEDLDTNHFYTITEPVGQSSIQPPNDDDQTQQKMFTRSESMLPAGLKHTEVEFDDFQRQPLIPNKYSQLGPGQAWGDIDGDGDADCYLGGGRGYSGQLLINENGQLAARSSQVIETHQDAEDMGALFFDVDGDNDQDLYVVSGGVEDEKGSVLYQDRLYLNDGAGQFSDVTAQWLPEIRSSGSCVTAADFDRDGDLDLFVGGRIIPGEYPMTPNSALLVNQGDRLENRIDDVASGLNAAGMVTAGLWTDVNNDGWIDLMVCCEWGPVRVFVNQQGQLQEETEATGLQQHLGWFNSICGGDIDADGDTDYVVGNFGLNTKYYATPEKPELMYYGNFGDGGKKRIVEAKFEDGVCLPRRGLGCTSSAIPMIKIKLPTYHEFAMSPLQDIYRLEGAQKFEANQLNSLVLINQSSTESVSFSIEPLPRIAQISPIFGCALSDLNGDGNLDLFVAQNFSGPQPETGNMAGGLSMVFIGQGDGSFEPVWPSESGVVITEDARSLSVVDLNQDRRPDLMIGVNDDAPIYYENRSAPKMNLIQLVGPTGNPDAIGAQLLISFSDGRTQSHEINAGSGYLSQSINRILVPASDSIQNIRVRWPDGKTITVTDSIEFDNGSLVIQYDDPA